MNDRFREIRPESFNLSPEEIEQYIKEGRRQRSEMAGVIFHHIAEAVSNSISGLWQSLRHAWHASGGHPAGGKGLEA